MRITLVLYVKVITSGVDNRLVRVRNILVMAHVQKEALYFSNLLFEEQPAIIVFQACTIHDYFCPTPYADDGCSNAQRRISGCLTYNLFTCTRLHTILSRRDCAPARQCRGKSLSSQRGASMNKCTRTLTVYHTFREVENELSP